MAELFTWELLIKLIAVTVASVTFAMLLRINRRHLVFAGIGAAMTYLLYATFTVLIDSLFVAAFISTLCTALYAEILARTRRAPTVIFTLTGVIPTVPGGDLYHAMRHLITGNVGDALTHLVITVEIGLGIAGGIVTMSILFGIFTDVLHAARRMREQKRSESNK